MLRILVVEDDPDIRAAVGDALGEAGHDVVSVGDGQLGLEQVRSTTFDVVVTDIRLPKVSGIALFQAVRQGAPTTAVILMTSFATANEAVAALKQGAHDYLTKPFDVEELVIRVRGIDERRALVHDLAEARAQLAAPPGGEILGAAPAIMRLKDLLATVADSDAPVLITGESGTGKELVARRLHGLSGRSAQPFIAVNCAAFPETLLEAELFGHERGAFTGAVKKRAGRFQAAHRGTLLLDEVAEIPLPAQAKLLRVLQEGSFEPLGSDVPVRVDVRLVSATHRDLKAKIAQGTFREDLYYRLNGINLHVPALRDRASDLPLLVNHFLGRFARPEAGGSPVPDVALDAWRALSAYPFPGNVRELGHAIQHAVVLARGARIDLEHLPPDIRAVAHGTSTTGSAEVRPLTTVVKQAEREHILRALAVAHGKRAVAADLLGISRKNLWEKLKAHDISDSDIDDPTP